MTRPRTILAAPFSRRMGRESAYMVASMVPAAVAFPFAVVGALASVLSIAGIGLPILAFVLLVARQVGRLFRIPAHAALGWDWSPPPPLDAVGPVSRVRSLLGDATAWRGLVYSFVKLPITVITVYLGAIGTAVGVLASTAPLWWPIGHHLGPYHVTGWRSAFALAVQGVAVLLITPWFVRAMVGLDRRLAYSLLAPDQNQARIVDLETGRQQLEADATNKLRRIERDLHDGTQARLVLLGLTLSRLDARTTDSANQAIIATAQVIVRDATEELRGIIRGVRPPALDDSLGTAITSLAATSPIGTTVDLQLHSRPADATATALYFAASELLSNSIRHAAATRAVVHLHETDTDYHLAVTDDGHGGATPTPSGTGLHGLQRRAAALDGSLVIDSPRGGPTAITLTLPKSGASCAS